MGLTLAEVPSRVDGEVKEGLPKLVDDAVTGGWPHARACRTLGISDVRVHRWRKRLQGIGSLEDLAPGGNPVHRLLGWEAEAILSLIEDWGPVDRTHRKLAHRGSYLGIVYVAPSTVLRVAESAAPGHARAAGADRLVGYSYWVSRHPATTAVSPIGADDVLTSCLLSVAVAGNRTEDVRPVGNPVTVGTAAVGSLIANVWCVALLVGAVRLAGDTSEETM